MPRKLQKKHVVVRNRKGSGTGTLTAFANESEESAVGGEAAVVEEAGTLIDVHTGIQGLRQQEGVAHPIAANIEDPHPGEKWIRIFRVVVEGVIQWKDEIVQDQFQHRYPARDPGLPHPLVDGHATKAERGPGDFRIPQA